MMPNYVFFFIHSTLSICGCLLLFSFELAKCQRPANAEKAKRIGIILRFCIFYAIFVHDITPLSY